MMKKGKAVADTEAIPCERQGCYRHGNKVAEIEGVLGRIEAPGSTGSAGRFPPLSTDVCSLTPSFFDPHVGAKYFP
jgi:hypothetical protein